MAPNNPPSPRDAEREHELKCWPEFFQAILDGTKRFEWRYDDRGFAEGDTLWLREWNPDTKTYSGRDMRVRVTYKLNAMLTGAHWWVVLSIVPVVDDAAAVERVAKAMFVDHRSIAHGVDINRAAREWETGKSDLAGAFAAPFVPGHWRDIARAALAAMRGGEGV